MSKPQLFASPVGGITGANMQRVEGIKNIQLTYEKEPKQMTPVQQHNRRVKRGEAAIASNHPTELVASKRKIRRLRKLGQKEGTEVFVHLKPQARVLGSVPMRPGKLGWEINNRALKRRERLYGKPEAS